MNKILIIDDEVTICTLLNRYLSKFDFEVSEAYNGKKALEMIEEMVFDVILCDYRLGDMSGDSIITKIKEKHPETPVIIMTGYIDYKTAVEVMRLGAYDYVSKPLVPTEILNTIREALKAGTAEKIEGVILEDKDLVPESRPKSTSFKKKHPGDSEHIFGSSPTFKKILEQIAIVAPTNYSVVIFGETGSGKEVIAKEIQQQSKRANKPFVAVDCGTLSRELSGSELFGHEKGAFTGAIAQKTGCFEVANGGTIFLDEIANLPYDIQVSLLRVIQERKMRRVGGTKDIDLDIRIIIASNEDLYQKVQDKKFREDLYHRFDEFSIAIPPLRERKEDIMTFANHFLKITNSEIDKNIPGFDPEIEEIFLAYPWLGNLRELKNVVRRAALLTPDNQNIKRDALPLSITTHTHTEKATETPVITNITEVIPATIDLNDNSLKQASNVAECTIILNALKQVNFNKSKAARLLNIDRKTLYNKLKAFMGTAAMAELNQAEMDLTGDNNDLSYESES